MIITPKEVIIVSPYENITKNLKNIVETYSPEVVVECISDLNGVMHAQPKSWQVESGKHYKSLHNIDYEGKKWDYKKESFREYIEKQLLDVNDAMTYEMLEGHNPTLIIDLEQLVGNQGDIIGVFNIKGFDKWCSQNKVPRLFLPNTIKEAIYNRMEKDGFQGCYTNKAYLDGNELLRAEQDLRTVLMGENKSLSLFQYQTYE